jgi:hypothetical protein
MKKHCLIFSKSISFDWGQFRSAVSLESQSILQRRKKLTGLTVSIEFRHGLDATKPATIRFHLKGGNRFRIRNVTNLLTGTARECKSNSSINPNDPNRWAKV